MVRVRSWQSRSIIVGQERVDSLPFEDLLATSKDTCLFQIVRLDRESSLSPVVHTQFLNVILDFRDVIHIRIGSNALGPNALDLGANGHQTLIRVNTPVPGRRTLEFGVSTLKSLEGKKFTIPGIPANNPNWSHRPRSIGS